MKTAYPEVSITVPEFSPESDYFLGALQPLGSHAPTTSTAAEPRLLQGPAAANPAWRRVAPYRYCRCVARKIALRQVASMEQEEA